MARETDYEQQNRSSEEQITNREKLLKLFAERPIPDEQLMVNLGLFMRSGALAKILYMDELYRASLSIPGVIMEFGIWWGQNIALLENLRAVYEPYNYSRRVIGFDTFEGYKSIGDKDVVTDTIKQGGYSVSEDYKSYLEQVIDFHEKENVMSHIKKHTLVEGDASVTVKQYLAEHPETIISLCYFDMALYEPTKAVLEAIKPHLIKGSVLAMDELNCPDYPGETIAVSEVLGLGNYEIRKSEYIPDRAYIVIN
jgi:hypothetical protein